MRNINNRSLRHRLYVCAMALLVCALALDGETSVKDAECAAVSFPNFFEVMGEAGADFRFDND